jgi:hypothetical protein
MLERPIGVYINWAAYDELSDNVELTEALALRQLDELLRLRWLGAWLNYYLMDAFWYAPDGGYRTWRKPHWPHGPDRWLDRCLSNGVHPGLWLSGNTLAKLTPIDAWCDSLDPSGRAMCFFHGGFWPNLLETLRYWYERGVRLYKFDFQWFGAAPLAVQRSLLPSEIYAMNVAAMRAGLRQLRADCPEVVLIAYNGFEEGETQARTGLPLRKTVDTRWLDTFDSLYCGDPRPADVPAMQFWRAKDIYSDHMVRVYQSNGIPLNRIDNSGFMIGTTGTCYRRGAAAWKGMLLLSLARGGWVNTYYGNLDLLDDEMGRWFAKAQWLFLSLQEYGRFSTFGAIPGDGEPYGFMAQDLSGALVTVVNPSQAVKKVRMPMGEAGRVLFCDAGFEPLLDSNVITLGPEQMALVGLGQYADPGNDLGYQEDVLIPESIQPLAAEILPEGAQGLKMVFNAPAEGDVRVIFRQLEKNGLPRRTTGGSPPDGIPLGQLLKLSAEQNGRAVKVEINYDKVIWSGLSWAVGEIAALDLRRGMPVTVHASTSEKDSLILKGEVYHVNYLPEG